MKFPWFSRSSRPQSRQTRSRRPFRPLLEGFETRELPASILVVPLGQAVDGTHRHSLADAMPFAGANGTVTIEPGSTPDPGTVTVTLAGLTIRGDGNVPGTILPRYDLNVNANQVTLD